MTVTSAGHHYFNLAPGAVKAEPGLPGQGNPDKSLIEPRPRHAARSFFVAPQEGRWTW